MTLNGQGALSTPSVGPAGVLYVNGTSNGAAVTITGSNPYKWSVTLPSLTSGDTVSMYITSTVAGVATARVVSEAIGDTVRMSDLATPTNITAGTITTVTNLTNAATSGDLTAAMKTSVTTAATAATPTAAAVTGAVGSVTGLTAANLDVAVSTRLATAGYTVPPTVVQIATEVYDQAAGVETGLTVRQALRLALAALAGKVSGGGTTTIVMRNAVADSKPRITATVDSSGNRTAITSDVA